MQKTLSAAAALALSLGAGMALADIAEGPWTLDDLVAVYPTVTADDFALIDTNNDSLVDKEELDTAVADGLLPARQG